MGEFPLKVSPPRVRAAQDPGTSTAQADLAFLLEAGMRPG